MAATIVTVTEAAARLLELMHRAEQGEEVVIAHGEHARVKLVPVGQAPKKRVFGQHRGQIRMNSDFDAPLPDAFWLSETP